jgi:hypothetical protein
LVLETSAGVVGSGHAASSPAVAANQHHISAVVGGGISAVLPQDAEISPCTGRVNWTRECKRI